jgi:hypothetical protein
VSLMFVDATDEAGLASFLRSSLYRTMSSGLDGHADVSTSPSSGIYVCEYMFRDFNVNRLEVVAKWLFQRYRLSCEGSGRR